MPGKKRECKGCQRVMRSDNLKKHEKICRGFLRRHSSRNSSYEQGLLHNTPDISKPMTNPPAPKITKSETNLMPILSTTSKLTMDDSEIDGLEDIEGSPSDITTIDGAEFSGEKPKSEKTLVKIMDMLKNPHENRAQLLKEETELDKKVRKKMKSSCNRKQDGHSPTPPIRVSMPHLSAEEKTLLNNFSRLFQEMKMNGTDNGKELSYMLDKLRNSGSIDEECFQKAFNAVGDLCNKSVL